MLLKHSFIIALLAVISFTATAQDIIYKTDGDSIIAKVKAVEPHSISYTRFDNINGPEYTLAKSDVARVKYANGMEDTFNERDMAARHHHGNEMPHEKDKGYRYGKNVITFSPFQFTENGLGFSFSYERTLDKQSLVSFYMPVIVTFNVFNAQDNYNNSNRPAPDAMFYAMPGIKLYPTGNKGRVKYAIGPNLVLATGQHTDYNNGFNPGTGSYIPAYTQSTHTIFGILVTNYVNFNPSKHVTTGFELGLGTTYVNRIAGVDNNAAFLIQGAFKIGYRF